MVYLWGHFWWIRAGARRGASTFRELIAVHGDSHEMEVLVGNSRRFVHWGLPLTTLFVYWTAVVMGHVVKVLHSVGKLKTNDVLHAKYMGKRTYPWKNDRLWIVNIGLVPPSNKPLPEPMLTQMLSWSMMENIISETGPWTTNLMSQLPVNSDF